MQNFKMSASEYLKCTPKYTISRLNNASRAFGTRPPHSKFLATPLQLSAAEAGRLGEARWGIGGHETGIGDKVT